MRLRILLVITIFLLSASSTFGGSDEDQVAREMADAAAKAAVKEMGYEAGKQLIDLGFKSVPPPAGEQTIGAEVVAWVRLGFAVNDFFNADTDKGKLFAGMDVAAAVVGIACPPAGAIVAVGVLAIKLVDAGVSKQHAKKMLEIAARIQKHYEEMLKIYRQLAEADFIRFSHSAKRLEEEYKEIQKYQAQAEDSCYKITKENIQLKDLENCRIATMMIYPHVANYLSYADQILNFRSQFFTLDQIYEKSDTSRKEMLDGVRSLSLSFLETQKKSTEFFNAVVKALAQIAVKRAIHEGSLDPITKLRNACYQEALRFNRFANLKIVRLVTKNKEKHFSELAELYRKANEGFDRGCLELSLGKEDPLFEQLVLREQTRAAVEKILFADTLSAISENAEVIQ